MKLLNTKNVLFLCMLASFFILKGCFYFDEAPDNLKAKRISEKQIELTFEDNSDREQ